MKVLAFSLSVPVDPAFRPLAAETAGKYGETLGLTGPEAAALAASAGEAVDLAAGTGPDVRLDVHRDGEHLEVTVSGGGRSSTLSRTLTATKST